MRKISRRILILLLAAPFFTSPEAAAGDATGVSVAWTFDSGG